MPNIIELNPGQITRDAADAFASSLATIGMALAIAIALATPAPTAALAAEATSPPGSVGAFWYRTIDLDVGLTSAAAILPEVTPAACLQDIDLDHRAMVYRFRQDYVRPAYLAQHFRNGEPPAMASEPHGLQMRTAAILDAFGQ